MQLTPVEKQEAGYKIEGIDNANIVQGDGSFMLQNKSNGSWSVGNNSGNIVVINLTITGTTADDVYNTIERLLSLRKTEEVLPNGI